MLLNIIKYVGKTSSKCTDTSSAGWYISTTVTTKKRFASGNITASFAYHVESKLFRVTRQAKLNIGEHVLKYCSSTEAHVFQWAQSYQTSTYAT